MKAIQSDKVLVGLDRAEMWVIKEALKAWRGPDPDPPVKAMRRIQDQERSMKLCRELTVDFTEVLNELDSRPADYRRPTPVIFGD